MWTPTQAAEQDPAKEKISLDLVDADLRDAVNLIFKDTKLNVVIADGVYGTGVTLKLDNVEREKALQLLLSSKGCVFTREGGVYMIKPKPGAQNNMMMPGGATGMMPGAEMPQVPGATMGQAAAPAGGAAPTAVASARQSLPEKIALRYIDAREVMYGLSGGNAGQYGGLGGGGFGGNSGFGGYGGNSFGGGFGNSFGGSSFGNSFGGSSFGNSFGGSSFGNSFGGSSFGSNGTNGSNSFNSGRQIFRPTLR